MKTRRLFPIISTVSPIIAVALAASLTAKAQTEPTLPVVSVTAPDAAAAESGDPGRFVLRRGGPTNLALHVYCVLDGSASNGVDYASIPSFIPIPAGIREVPVPVNPINDADVEGSEAVVLRLVPSPVMIPVNYLIGSPSNAVVNIADNDGPPPTHQPPTVRVVMPTNGASFTAPANIQICADARDEDGYVDFVEFFANNLRIGARTNCLLCASIQNPFCFVWTNVPPGEYMLTAKATDDDGASRVSEPVHISVRSEPVMSVVTVLATDPIATEIPLVPQGMGMPQRIDSGEFTVSRTGSTALPLSVYYRVSGTASNGVDYELLSGVVTIPAGAVSAPVEVAPIDDLLVEGTEIVVLRLSDIACIAIYPPPPECYMVGTSREAVVQILDNDPSGNLPPQALVTRPFDGQTFVAPVNVPIRVETVDRDGYVDHVEFYAGTNQIGEQTRYYLTPPPAGQPAVYEMVWTNPPLGRHELRVKARDDQGAIGWSLPVKIWVVETNLPPHTNLPIVSITAPDCVASEGTNCVHWAGWSNEPVAACCFRNTATFVIRRSGPTNDALTVHYRIGGTASNGVDYVTLPGLATIPAGRRAVEIKLGPIDDLLPERIETVVLGLRLPPDLTSNLAPYLIGCPGRAAAVIADNDAPRPGTGPLPDRCFHIMRPGANGTCWRIEASTDMIHWTPICTAQVTDGAIHFVDPDAEDAPKCFYRAVPAALPPPE